MCDQSPEAQSGESAGLDGRHLFFIVSVGRSGSTSLSTLFDQASNAACLTEPVPDLGWACREVMEGRLTDIETIDKIMDQNIIARASKYLEEFPCYGEKHLNYGPFIERLYQRFQAKFILNVRDGRDVVRSFINWHNHKYGNIYRECQDPGQLSPTARHHAALVSLEDDTSDYSRPRPRPEDDVYDSWDEMSRFEMLAWYWSRANEYYFDQMEKIPDSNWLLVDFASPTVESIRQAIDFLGLEDISNDLIADHLSQRVNSLGSATEQHGLFPRWPEWPPDLARRFDELAGKMMTRLGYYPVGSL